MKKTLFFLVSLLPVFAFAQITIYQGDMPQEGDTIRTSTGIDISGIDFTETGNNFVWDFTEVTPLSQRVDTFVSVGQTPFVYQVVFFLSANLAREMMEFEQFPGFTVTDTYEYYKNQSSDYRSVGFGVTLNGIPIPNKYQESDIIYRFPMEYNNEDSSMSSYEIAIPGLGYLGGWKKRVNHVDGWGELKSPYGNFDVIRVASDIVQFDSLYIDSLGFGIPVNRNYTEYKWMGEDKGLPLFQVDVEGPLQTITYIDSVRNLLVGTTGQLSLPGFNVYPNPASEQVFVEIPDMQGGIEGISLIGLDGTFNEVLEWQTVAANKIRVSLSDFDSGVYFIRVNVAGEQLVERVLIK